MVSLQENVNVIIEESGNAVPQEEIPFRRSKSRENKQKAAEIAEREKIYKIFKQYDENGDEKINLKEFKSILKGGYCRQLSRGLTLHLLYMNDKDGDKQLNFEEFYQLSKQNKWLFSTVMNKYCRAVVPEPNRQICDQVDGAYEREMQFCPPPLTMIIISFIEIIFFLTDVIYFQNNSTNNEDHENKHVTGPIATLFIYNPTRRYEVWRFITYMFVHDGKLHLIINLVFQIFLGVALELVHDWWRIILIYLAGVIAGSIGNSIYNPEAYLAGASGGVYAIITAHIATIILNWKQMEYAVIQLAFILIFCVTDLGVQHDDKVGYAAHLCGALAGLLVGIGVLRNLKEEKFEKILWWIAVSTYSLLMIIGIGMHIFYSDNFLENSY